MLDKDMSRKLRPIKNGPYPVVKVCHHTLTVDVNGIYNVVSIDKVSLAKTCNKASSSSTTRSSSESDEGCTPIGVPHNTARTALKQANMRSASWSMTGNILIESNIGLVDMATRQSRIHGDSLSTSRITLCCNVDVKNRSRGRRLLRPTTNSELWERVGMEASAHYSKQLPCCYLGEN